MNLSVIIPVRGLADGKSRLHGAMPDRARRALVMALLDQTVTAVRAADIAEHVIVVTPDTGLLRWAPLNGCVAMRQVGTGLNAALAQAEAWATQQGADAVLVVHPDLPLITAADIQALAAEAPEALGAVVVGDRRREGTTALLLRPPAGMPYRFGDQSYVRHLTSGEARGLRVVASRVSALGFDIDTPADLRDLALRHPIAFTTLGRATLRWLPRLAQDATFTAPPALPRPVQERRS
jgi:2-phospho-L-lactate guanylyltransferase